MNKKRQNPEHDYSVYIKEDKMGFYIHSGTYKDTVVSIEISEDGLTAELEFVQLPKIHGITQDEDFHLEMERIVNEILQDVINLAKKNLDR